MFRRLFHRPTRIYHTLRTSQRFLRLQECSDQKPLGGVFSSSLPSTFRARSRGFGAAKANERKNSRRARIFLVHFVLIPLLKLLRHFGKNWQYGSKLKDSFAIFLSSVRSPCCRRYCFHDSHHSCCCHVTAVISVRAFTVPLSQSCQSLPICTILFVCSCPILSSRAVEIMSRICEASFDFNSK